MTDLDDLLESYDYDLPLELIAQHPLPERSGSRLLVLDRGTGAVRHRRFTQLLEHLAAGDCLVLNDTRVLPARLLGRAPSGSSVEFLLVKQVSADEWDALARPSRRCRPGRTYRVGSDPWLDVEVRARLDDQGLHRVRLAASGPVMTALESLGHVPLPPYIKRPDAPEDRARYQTVYARHPGAVAAPTAGLHFDEPMLDEVRRAGVHVAYLTLHVGLATFRPVTAARLSEHQMHGERYVVPPECADLVQAARAEGGRVVAVGTTVVRVLESVADAAGLVRAGAGETDLFIRPGYRFRAVDAMLTNFHLPRSTLLALVSAFAGRERVLAAYREAVALRYRFYSYGDAMLLL